MMIELLPDLREFEMKLLLYLSIVYTGRVIFR